MDRRDWLDQPESIPLLSTYLQRSRMAKNFYPHPAFFKIFERYTLLQTLTAFADSLCSIATIAVTFSVYKAEF